MIDNKPIKICGDRVECSPPAYVTNRVSHPPCLSGSIVIVIFILRANSYLFFGSPFVFMSQELCATNNLATTSPPTQPVAGEDTAEILESVEESCESILAGSTWASADCVNSG